MKILGISSYYHDSAACLLEDGNIVAAAQEERFSRKKHDARFPENAIRYCLQEASSEVTDLDIVVFYDKPFLTFERLLETYCQYAPRGFQSFRKAMPLWLKEKFQLRRTIARELTDRFQLDHKQLPEILFSEHHHSHAASAFYPSPYEEAAVLCLDGVGEWATTSAWKGSSNSLTPLWEIRFPHSLGLLYSAMTYFTGYKVNSGEYKVMGLAPYGRPVYADALLKHVIDLKADGTFRLNMKYFDYCVGLTMTSSKLEELFGGPPRTPEGPVTQREMDIAASIQVVTEEVVLRLAKKLHRETGLDNLCLAGGVALNCVANGRLVREGHFKQIWIQPAAGDSGGALGCAYVAWHEFFKHPRKGTGQRDSMRGSFLGPSFSVSEVETFLQSRQIPYRHVEDPSLFQEVAGEIQKGHVVGWFQGRMEFGPRALGSRSIIGDPRSPRMQSIMNQKIKFRESFRPFAPAVLHDHAEEYFGLSAESPYMLLVSQVQTKFRLPLSEADQSKFGIDLLLIPKSTVPAITHVDYSARIQTVHPEVNPRFYSLIHAFKEQTGCPVLVNTSFNVRGEPIVCTPEDAYRCFRRTEMDVLVLGNFILDKKTQHPILNDSDWRKEFELD